MEKSMSLITKVILVALLCLPLLFKSSMSCSYEDINTDLQEAVSFLSPPYSLLIKLLKTIGQINSTRNVVISPTSIHHISLMVYFLAQNDTNEKQQLGTMLEIPYERDEHNIASYIKLMNRYDGIKQLKLMNKIYHDLNITLPHHLTEEILCHEIEAKNFRNSFNYSIESINEWIQKSTNNETHRRINQKLLNQNINLFLFSLAYFKGEWKYQFWKENTDTETFTDENGVKYNVSMMLQRDYYSVCDSQELESKIIKIPLENYIYMIVVLPENNTPGLITNVINRMNRRILRKIQTGFCITKTRLFLPKFSLVSEFRYKEILTSVPLQSSSRESNLTISESLHMAAIAVEENKDEDVRFSINRTRTASKFIKCNQPFIYFIYDDSAEVTLFEGIYRRPENNIVNQPEN